MPRLTRQDFERLLEFRVTLTRLGERILYKLTRAHLDRLHELAVVLDELVAQTR